MAIPSGSGAGYEVAFHLDHEQRDDARHVPAEQWLRLMFEDAPVLLRWFLLAGWTALTCRLHPRRSPARILGWRLDAASQDRAVMAVDAWIGLSSRLVLEIDGDGVTVTSLVTYWRRRKLAARAMWAMTIPLHERILPYLLRRAARGWRTPPLPGGHDQ